MRADIMKLADQENGLRQQLIEVQRLKNEGICRLVECAESFLPHVLAAAPPGKEPKKVSYDTKDPSPEDIAAAQPSGRTCKGCGGTGHDRRNCPKANETFKEARKPKKGKGKR